MNISYGGKGKPHHVFCNFALRQNKPCKQCDRLYELHPYKLNQWNEASWRAILILHFGKQVNNLDEEELSVLMEVYVGPKNWVHKPSYKLKTIIQKVSPIIVKLLCIDTEELPNKSQINLGKLLIAIFRSKINVEQI